MRFGLALALLTLGGCGTIHSMIEGPRVYGGVQADLHGMKQPYFGFNYLLALDLPLSAAFDTALLPLTIWFEIFRKEEPTRPDRWSPLEEKAKP